MSQHNRTTFFQSPGLPGGSATTIPGSTGLGVYNTGGYARFVGLFSIVGSITLQYRMGVFSGNYQVTSSVVVNSGGSSIDVLNLGRFTEFTFSAANSQTPTYYIMGETVR